MAISGTKEWAVSTYNISRGCSHDCRYCYARHNAVIRRKQCTADQWPIEQINWKAVQKKWKKRTGRIMFPSSHGITPGLLGVSIHVLRQMLEAGNEVLVVTKGRYHCMMALYSCLGQYKDQLNFRFTITGKSSDLLRYWEPQAPSYVERWRSLAAARNIGYATSVSMEPLLEPGRLDGMIAELLEYVTDTIWIGKMNMVRQRVMVKTKEDRLRVEEIERGQTDDRIQEIYSRYKNHRKIRWKDSIKKVVGIPLATEAGMDA